MKIDVPGQVKEGSTVVPRNIFENKINLNSIVYWFIDYKTKSFKSYSKDIGLQAIQKIRVLKFHIDFDSLNNGANYWKKSK